MAGSRFSAANAMIRSRRVSKYGVRADQQRADLLADQGREGGVQLRVVAGLCDEEPLRDHSRRSLDFHQLACGRRKVGIEENAGKRNARDELVQHTEPLGLHLVGQQRVPGRIAARPVEAFHETGLDRDRRPSRTRWESSRSPASPRRPKRPRRLRPANGSRGSPAPTRARVAGRSRRAPSDIR